MEATIPASKTMSRIHPFVAAFGPGPFSIFATIHLPALDLRDRDEAEWERRLGVAAGVARSFGVELGVCGCCGHATSESIIGEPDHGNAKERRRFAVCRRCVQRHGGRVLNRKLAYIDRTHEGYARQSDTDRAILAAKGKS
jgi:hypothetical protein